MLCISPAAGSATFGYIYLSDTKWRHEAAITANFDSAGRKVAVIPCPDFEQFITDNNLLYRNLLLSPISPGILSRQASVSSRLRITAIPGATTGSRTHLLYQVLGHHCAPQIRPVRPHPSALAPSCHATPPPLDLVWIRTDLPPTYLTTTLILPLLSDTSGWGAAMRSQAVVMGGCPR